MTIWKRFAWLLLVPALAAMLLVACGGGGDDDDDDDRGPSIGDERDDENDDDNDASPGGDDERYVAQVCAAMKRFQEGLSEQSSNFDPEDFEDVEDLEDLDFAEVFVGPLEDLISDMEDADPPGDVEEYHDDGVEQLKAALDELRDGNIEAFEAIDAPIEPPDDVVDRLDAAAADNEDCQEIGFGFE